MPEGSPYYVWPVADEQTLVWIMLFLIGIFVGAVCLELYRRRRDKSLRLRAEWRGAREFCDERDLLTEDWTLLRAMLQQYAADHPFAAVTKRTKFDECLEHYFKAIALVEKEDAVIERGIRLRHIRVQLGLDYVPLGQRIHTTRSLKLKQRLSVSNADGAPDWQQFVITDMNEATFRISFAGPGGPPAVAPGSHLKCRLWRDEDARYLFDVILLNVDPEKGGWEVWHADTITRNQSRAYFRLRMEQSVEVSILDASLKEDYKGIYDREAVTQVRGRLTSLSGGGLAIAFQQPIPKQVLLRFAISIPSLGGALRVIVRPIASQSLAGGQCQLRGMFVNMDEETREAITRYIFSKQKLLSSTDAAER